MEVPTARDRYQSPGEAARDGRSEEAAERPKIKLVIVSEWDHSVRIGVIQPYKV